MGEANGGSQSSRVAVAGSVVMFGFVVWSFDSVVQSLEAGFDFYK